MSLSDAEIKDIYTQHSLWKGSCYPSKFDNSDIFIGLIEDNPDLKNTESEYYYDYKDDNDKIIRRFKDAITILVTLSDGTKVKKTGKPQKIFSDYVTIWV